jgi:hypothetical protein
MEYLHVIPKDGGIEMNMRSNKFFLMSVMVGLASLFSTTTGQAAEKTSAFPEVVPGLTYVHERIGDQPWSIHVLKIDRSRNDFKLISTLGQGKLFGLQQMSKQIEDVPAELGKPVAAVNGDFFEIEEGPYKGDLCGLHICQGEIVSDPKGGASFWIDPAGQFHQDPVRSQFQVTWPNGNTTPFSLNQQRNDNAAVLYTPTLGESTRTEGGVELVLEAVDAENWLPLNAGKTYRAKVKSVLNAGNTPLSPEIMVLSIGAKLVDKIPAIKIGDTIILSTATTPSLANVATAIGGGPVLVHEGKIQLNSNQDRHPRTMIGWNDKYFFFVVVDGRQEGLSKGMNCQEMAELMFKLGATEAMNIDGGGSSTFWLGGQILNSPSDGNERSVANGLVLLRKPAPTTTTAPAEKK